MKQKKLTPKQQAFAEYYIESGNATESAVKAGYSKRTAQQIGTENLSKPVIKSYIDEKLAEISSNRIADATEVLETLTAIVRGESRSATLIGIGEGAQMIENEMPPSTAERIRAAELLGKRYKLFTEKAEVEVTGAVQFVDDITGDSDDTN